MGKMKKAVRFPHVRKKVVSTRFSHPWAQLGPASGRRRAQPLQQQEEQPSASYAK